MFADFYKNMENSEKWYHFDYCNMLKGLAL